MRTGSVVAAPAPSRASSVPTTTTVCGTTPIDRTWKPGAGSPWMRGVTATVRRKSSCCTGIWTSTEGGEICTWPTTEPVLVRACREAVAVTGTVAPPMSTRATTVSTRWTSCAMPLTVTTASAVTGSPTSKPSGGEFSTSTLTGTWRVTTDSSRTTTAWGCTERTVTSSSRERMLIGISWTPEGRPVRSTVAMKSSGVARATSSWRPAILDQGGRDPAGGREVAGDIDGLHGEGEAERLGDGDVLGVGDDEPDDQREGGRGEEQPGVAAQPDEAGARPGRWSPHVTASRGRPRCAGRGRCRRGAGR